MAKKYSTLDITALIDAELASFVVPKVKDPAKATDTELLKDLHRVIVGNGGHSRGMLWKLAETRVDLRRISNDLVDVDTKVDRQIELCAGVRDKADRAKSLKDNLRRADEERRSRRIAVVSWLLNNKAVIAAISAVAAGVLGWTQGCVVVVGGSARASEAAQAVSQVD